MQVMYLCKVAYYNLFIDILFISAVVFQKYTYNSNVNIIILIVYENHY